MLSIAATSVTVHTPDGLYIRIEPVAPHTFHIRASRTGTFDSPAPLARLGIVAPPALPALRETEEAGDELRIVTETAALRINRLSGEMSLSGIDGKPLARLTRPPFVGGQASGPDGDRDRFEVQFALAKEERLYGLGDHYETPLMKRGYRVDIRLLGRVHAPVPLLLSSEGWALLMDTDQEHAFDVGCSEPDRMSVCGSGAELAFYWIAGGNLAELLEKYTALTGPAALLPIWAYGLTFNCNQQATARDMIEDALKFRREGIPCDMIGLEPTWMDRSFDYDAPVNWHPDRFYIPQWMPEGAHTFMGVLRTMGFKLTLGLYLRDQDGTAAHRDAELQWYDYLKPFVAQGVQGFNLCTRRPVQEQVNAADSPDGAGPDRSILPQSTVLGRVIQEGFAAQTGRRPLICTPVGYTGIQKYAAIWSGGRPKPHLSVLSLGLSGIPHMAADMNLHTAAGIHCGFFQPWSKVNSWAYWRHPLLLDSGLLRLFKMYAKLRYRLLPYIYSAAHVAVRTGLPIARAMPLAYPDDPRAVELHNQYMFGDDFLVAVFTEQVYLPAGEWIDYWSGKTYSGPAEIAYRTPEQAGGPLLVRAGAIVPMWPDVQYAGQQPAERLELHLYPGGSREYAFNEDDGTTFGYRSGEWATTRIACEEDRRGFSVEIAAPAGCYTGMPENRTWDIVIHYTDKPAAVKVDGEDWRESAGSASSRKDPPPSSWSYHRKTGTIRLIVQVDAGRLSPVRIEASRSGKAETRQASVRSQPLRPSGTKRTAGELEKDIEVGLETSNTAKALSALEDWWNIRTARSDAAEDVREHWLAMNGLFVRAAERKGRTLHEIAEEDPRFGSSRQPPDNAEEAYASLAQAVSLIIESNSRQPGKTNEIVRQTTDIIRSELDRELSLHAVADRLHLNSSYLSRRFKREIGLSFSDYVLEKKMELAKELLLAGSTVSAAAERTGFKDTSYFIRVFRKYWGVRPGEMKP